jgi:hypothetical protein
VIRRYDSVCSQEVIVLLPDQTRCALPSWMLDEVFCASLVEADHPILSVGALCNLDKLLDDTLLPVADSSDECKLVPSPQESRSSSQRPSATVAASGQPRRELHAGDGSRAVSAVSRRVTRPSSAPKAIPLMVLIYER